MERTAHSGIGRETQVNRPPEIVIAGCGALGSRLATRYHARGLRVEGFNRTGPGDPPPPWKITAADLTQEKEVVAISERWGGSPACLFVCLSSRGGDAAEYRRVYLETTSRLLDIWQPVRVVYAGSTSVYSRTDGAWVDELTPAEPSRETGKILRQTEQKVLESGGIVARLAGLYGPGRCALLKKFLVGSAFLDGDGEKFTNYVHINDAAAAMTVLAEKGEGGTIYNVSDGNPLSQREIYEWLAKQTGRPMPPARPPDLERKRGWSNKRVASDRLRALEWQPRWPDFRTGLGALLSE